MQRNAVSGSDACQALTDWRIDSTLKRPRQHAAHILTLNTLAERREYLVTVPEDQKAMVKKHVELWWHRRA